MIDSIVNKAKWIVEMVNSGKKIAAYGDSFHIPFLLKEIYAIDNCVIVLKKSNNRYLFGK